MEELLRYGLVQVIIYFGTPFVLLILGLMIWDVISGDDESFRHKETKKRAKEEKFLLEQKAKQEKTLRKKEKIFRKS